MVPRLPATGLPSVRMLSPVIEDDKGVSLELLPKFAVDGDCLRIPTAFLVYRDGKCAIFAGHEEANLASAFR